MTATATKFRQTIDLGMGQTSNLTFDESYGNEQNINSVSVWNVLVHVFADTARQETFWCGFSRGRQLTTTNFSFFFFFLNFNVRTQNSTLRQFALQVTDLGSCNNGVVDWSTRIHFIINDFTVVAYDVA